VRERPAPQIEQVMVELQTEQLLIEQLKRHWEALVSKICPAAQEEQVNVELQVRQPVIEQLKAH
jgi:hypothetical protein